jgi:hypothetical protein
MIAVRPVDDTGNEHQQPARQTDSEHRDDCPQRSTEFLAHENRRVRGIQARNALAD